MFDVVRAVRCATGSADDERAGIHEVDRTGDPRNEYLSGVGWKVIRDRPLDCFHVLSRSRTTRRFVRAATKGLAFFSRKAAIVGRPAVSLAENNNHVAVPSPFGKCFLDH